MSFISMRHNLAATHAGRDLTAHYASLADSVRRLSTGLRVERAADDAAGLAIRELMRADVASLHQGARNVSDAISLIQTADGALAVIDEKLIRMKELSEQAATGTYDSTQRLMIDSEFQQMASEIERIARATDFNGIHLLDGSLSGPHDGSRMEAGGALKIHFGAGNDSAEDYYYIQVGDATLKGLGLMDGATGGATGGGGGGGGGAIDYGDTPILSDVFQQNKIINLPKPQGLSVVSVGVIPAGTTNFSFFLDDNGRNDTIQIFTRSGKHIAGTTVSSWSEYGTQPVDINSVLTEKNGFFANAVYDGSKLNGTGANIPVDYITQKKNNFTIDGMNVSYTGDGGDRYWPETRFDTEEIEIDLVAEDLIIVVAGYYDCKASANWTAMPQPGDPGVTPDPGQPGAGAEGDETLMSIKTQELAQKGIERLNGAIVRKDQIRSHLGATQNRLENTATNLAIQTENLQTAESRISDMDVAAEMTAFVRNQVLSESATSVLAQANSFPQMLLRLIES